MQQKWKLLVLVALVWNVAVKAQPSTIFHQQGIALHGYDVVAFFTDSMAVKGLPENSYTWQGVQWLFSSPAHRQVFAADPERYAPMYGGFCAYGTAGGYKAKTEINTWTIVGGKLYFNYNSKVKERWQTDIPGYIEKANGHWPGIKDTKPSWQQ